VPAAKSRRFLAGAAMKPLWVALVITLIGVAGCRQKESSAQPSRPAAEDARASAAADHSLQNPFPSASELRLFVDTREGRRGPIYSKPAGLVLSSGQRAKFESLISVHTISDDDAFAMCFMPHHFFRYYDRAGRLVGEISVCFCCGGVEQTAGLSIPLRTNQMLIGDFAGLDSFVRSLGERTDVQCED
jgi:hypothetical protein